MATTCHRQDCTNPATVLPVILFWSQGCAVEIRNESNCARFLLDLDLCSECAAIHQRVDEYMHPDHLKEWAKEITDLGMPPPDLDSLTVTFTPIIG